VAEPFQGRTFGISRRSSHSEIFWKVCSSGQTYHFRPSSMSHLGKGQSEFQMRYKRCRYGFL